MDVLEKRFLSLVYRLNWVSSLLIVAMMLLTCADVILRFFRHPVTGTYEMVGLIGSLVISLSLAHTFEKKGHIAVEFLMRKFPRKIQDIVHIFNCVLSMILFGFMTRETFLYAGELKRAGEVSLTLHMPTYPYVYGISLGCGVFVVLLFMKIVKGIRRALVK
jgi:TRAP-type C4-dicarboxylate transport system permease small subunit